MALILDDDGVHLPFGNATPADIDQAASERVSLGIERLDQVLGGGPHRGSTTLVSGRPGTAKTTIAGGFAEAAAARGERVLYLSFDEIRANVIRNAASVGIDLRPHVDSGQLRFCGREAWSSLAEEHYMAVLRLLDEFQPDCLGDRSRVRPAQGGERRQRVDHHGAIAERGTRAAHHHAGHLAHDGRPARKASTR
ncbi:MAG: ATPase domain-containing protein [Halofilum sp. (in: g-proteobacteria)]|nr:ATPase domain-containing protein [Halofilum sp. (in: g-proteobacteria)]